MEVPEVALQSHSRRVKRDTGTREEGEEHRLQLQLRRAPEMLQPQGGGCSPHKRGGARG